MNVLVAILGLGLLVIVHEAGHFLTALGVGMRPRSFNVGFGPPLAKVTRGGVDYALRIVPLGGYVKIPGMHRPAPSDADVYFGPALRNAPELVGPVERLKRALAVGEHAAAASALDDIEEAASPGGLSGGARRGMRELRDSLGPEAYWRQRTWRKVAVIFAGPAVNFLFAVLLFGIVLASAGGKATSVVDQTLAGRPARAIGLQPGDEIVAVNGNTVQGIQIVHAVRNSRGKLLALTVLRHGKPVYLEPARAQKRGGVYQLGFTLHGEGLGPAQASWQSVKLTAETSREIVKSLGGIVHKRGRDQISSPVGIVRESAAQARHGWQDYLLVLGFISVSLGLLNLLPLLPLDGGHIAFSLAEGIRGRAVSREVYERVSAVGLALVVLLFFVGLSNDVGRIGGG